VEVRQTLNGVTTEL